MESAEKSVDIETIIKDMIEHAKKLRPEVVKLCEDTYLDGVHNTLVELLDKLSIEHEEKVIDYNAHKGKIYQATKGKEEEEGK